MTPFTKEELELMLDWFGCFISESYFDKEELKEHWELHDKIERILNELKALERTAKFNE